MWPTWVSIIFLFLPGILYQIQVQNGGVEYLANFSGLLIIIFLSLSLYYAIPFIVSGALIYSLSTDSKKKENNVSFTISVFSILVYWVTWFFSLLNKIDFWTVYLVFLLMLFLGIMIKGIFNYTENRLKRKRR